MQQVQDFFQHAKLTPEERNTTLTAVLGQGWTLVENRDAIYKEFLFKDFNQVIFQINICNYLSKGKKYNFIVLHFLQFFYVFCVL